MQPVSAAAALVALTVATALPAQSVPDFLAEARAVAPGDLDPDQTLRWVRAAETYLSESQEDAFREEIRFRMVDWVLLLSGDKLSDELIAAIDVYLTEFPSGPHRDRVEWMSVTFDPDNWYWETGDDGVPIRLAAAQAYADYLATRPETTVREEIRHAIAFELHAAAEMIESFGALNPGYTIQDSATYRARARAIWTELLNSDDEEVVLRARYALERRNVYYAGSPRCLAIAGEVARGEDHAQEFGDGFVFRLRAEKHPRNPNGWTIEIGRVEDPEVELSYAASPPYRFFNPRYVSTGYGHTAESAVALDIRTFAFFRDAEVLAEARQALELVLWPADHEIEDVNDARHKLDSLRSWVARTGRGELRVVDSRIGGPIEHQPGGTIDALTFQVELCPPR